MRDIDITYDATTRLMTPTTTHTRNDVAGGTVGDVYTTRINFTFTGDYGDYTPTLAVRANIKDKKGHTVYNPEFTLDDDNSVILPGYVMSSVVNGRLPIQLHFISTVNVSKGFYSENQINLTLTSAIMDLKEAFTDSPDSTLNYAKVIRTASITTNATDTTYVWTYSLDLTPSAVTVLELVTAATSTTAAVYEEVYVNKTVTKDKVTLIFPTPPGQKTFYMKVLI